MWVITALKCQRKLLDNVEQYNPLPLHKNAWRVYNECVSEYTVELNKNLVLVGYKLKLSGELNFASNRAQYNPYFTSGGGAQSEKKIASWHTLQSREVPPA